MKTLITAMLLFSSISFAANEALLQEIITKAKASSSDSLIIIEDEKVLYSDFFGNLDKVRNTQSVTKSITGLAIGILLDEGKINSLDQSMTLWFPEWVLDPQKSKITLRMIMNHTSGISDASVKDFFLNPDLIAVARNVSAISPGTRFEYSSVATVLLQVVINQSAGIPVDSFIHEKILTPLKIASASWRKDQAGHEVLSGGLSLDSESLVKIGTLILNEGKYETKQVIKKETLQVLLSKSQPYQDYGLLWWLRKANGASATDAFKLFVADGYGGQYIVVYPDKKLVAVRTKDFTTISESQYKLQSFPEFRGLIGQWQ